MKGYVKALIIVVIILILYTIMVGAIAKNRNNKNNKKDEPTSKPTEKTTNKVTNYDANIILLPNTILGYSGGVWEENKALEFDNKDFTVYTDQVYQNVKLISTDHWHIMRKDNSFIDYHNDFIAINASIPIEAVSNTLSTEITPENEAVIKEFLNSNSIKYDYDKLNKNVFVFDVNHDGLRDEIYTVTNVFLEDYLGFDNTFAYVFVRTLNQNIVLYEKIINNINAMNTCNPLLQGVITVDNTSYIVVECNLYSDMGAKHFLYNIADKKAFKVIETEAN